MRKVLRWLTGRPFDKWSPKGGLMVIGYSPQYWEFYPGGGSMVFHMRTAPNALHRLMQRICFGFVYKMKEN